MEGQAWAGPGGRLRAICAGHFKIPGPSGDSNGPLVLQTPRPRGRVSQAEEALCRDQGPSAIVTQGPTGADNGNPAPLMRGHPKV